MDVEWDVHMDVKISSDDGRRWDGETSSDPDKWKEMSKIRVDDHDEEY